MADRGRRPGQSGYRAWRRSWRLAGAVHALEIFTENSSAIRLEARAAEKFSPSGRARRPTGWVVANEARWRSRGTADLSARAAATSRARPAPIYPADRSWRGSGCGSIGGHAGTDRRANESAETCRRARAKGAASWTGSWAARSRPGAPAGPAMPIGLGRTPDRRRQRGDRPRRPRDRAPGGRGAAAELVVGSVGDPTVVGPLLRRRRIRPPSTAPRPIVGRRERARAEPYERENVTGGRALLGELAAAASTGTSSARRRRSTACRPDANHRGDGRALDQLIRRDQTAFRGRPSGCGRNRHARGGGCATSTWPVPATPAARTMNPRPISSRPASSGRDRRARDLFGDDYPTPDGTAVRD